MLGQTADISHICEIPWYSWVLYHESQTQFPEDKMILGRYLGPTDPGIGSVMSAKILKSNGEVVRRRSYRLLDPIELDTEENCTLRKTFDESIEKRLGLPLKESELGKEVDVYAVTPTYSRYEDDESPKETEIDLDDLVDTTGGTNPNVYDGYICSQVMLPKGDEMLLGTVKKRSLDANGVPVGTANDNPILDTRVYEVEFSDGAVYEYAANVIAENMYSQVDQEGHRFLLMDSIVDHKKTKYAIAKEDGFVTLNGKKCKRITTKGWKFCVRWKDGSTSWESLTALKESNPIEVAEYAVSQNLRDEPAFAWWIAYALRRRTRIIAKLNKRYIKRTHKFGIELPKTVAEALEIDRRTGTTFWTDAIMLEVRNVDVAFEDLADDVNVPIGYQFVKCHMVFDVKVGSLKRKARYVAGGHMTEPPASMTYASVVSRESVRLGLLIAALNDLEVLTADIQNAYLTSPCEEKIYTILGPEFGPERQGRKALVVRALYGLKSAGAAFRNHLASCLRHIGYESSKGDPDVWLKPATKPDGEEYYEYLLVYTDDILAISMDPRKILNKLNKYFAIKPDSVVPPDNYLGTKIKPTTLPNGKVAWGQSSSQYIKTAVDNVKRWLADRGQKLPKKASTPMAVSYRPELDISQELSSEDANYYQSLIGVLRWAVEIGRIDITTEVSMLAAHMALPRIGHLDAVLRIFAYLNRKHNSRLVFDPAYPEIKISDFNLGADWSPMYENVKEAIPPNAPKPRGKSVVLRLYVDADHAGDQVTRRSRSGYVQLVNMAPINWYSKKQGSIERSTFGSEFVSLCTAMEANRALRYKLRMMGVPIDGPTYTYVDNMSVVKNTSLPESVLKKKSNAIVYHACREAMAMGEMCVTYVPSKKNIADLMTKVLPNGEYRDYLIQCLMWDIT